MSRNLKFWLAALALLALPLAASPEPLAVALRLDCAAGLCGGQARALSAAGGGFPSAALAAWRRGSTRQAAATRCASA